MKILIAPDSFKGTLTAQEVCDIIGQAFSDTIKTQKYQSSLLPTAARGFVPALGKSWAEK